MDDMPPQAAPDAPKLESKFSKMFISNKIKDILNNDMPVTGKTSDLFGLCATEFIHVLIRNTIASCENSDKVSITTSNLLDTLEKLGFGHYKEKLRDLGEASNRQHIEKSRKRKAFAKSLNEITKQEQEQLLERAKKQAQESGYRA